MVKGAQKRRMGGGCTLDPKKVDEYISHFKSTFGGPPTGETPDTSRPTGPAKEELTLDMAINHSTVKAKIQSLPRGKAWGADDIPAEFFQAGAVHLIKPLTAFLSLVYVGCTIPSIWRIARVVPI